MLCVVKFCVHAPVLGWNSSLCVLDQWRESPAYLPLVVDPCSEPPGYIPLVVDPWCESPGYIPRVVDLWCEPPGYLPLCPRYRRPCWQSASPRCPGPGSRGGTAPPPVACTEGTAGGWTQTETTNKTALSNTIYVQHSARVKFTVWAENVLSIFNEN